MSKYFDDVKKNFGFGLMRLPMKGEDVDYEQVNKMVDLFLSRGFNYFDTAHGYLDGKSEIALRKCVVERYPRDRYIVTNKLSTSFFTKEEEILPLFEKQLEATGLTYFDFYLLHAQDSAIYAKYEKCHAYEVVKKLKEEGRVRHIGISFHDKAEVLDKILSEHPEVEVVQIQFNYLDYLDEAVDSKRVYETARKYNKPVIVMEPVKGGTLVNLPKEADQILKDLNGGSNASYAIRYASSFDGIFMTLSGMSDIDQMDDNSSYMENFKPLSKEELDAINRVCDVFKSLEMIKCTSCRYCILDNDCPKKINIPGMFSCYNKKMIFKSWNQDYYYNNIVQAGGGRAKDCIKCGKCEKICPQHLPIREYLEKVSAEFDK